jgi:hypothetical protein
VGGLGSLHSQIVVLCFAQHLKQSVDVFLLYQSIDIGVMAE